jgi:D-sedoheptulose 7-phosphate isomerase
MMSLASGYIRELQATLDTLPIDTIDQVIATLNQARYENRQVFIMGNGGSAATASHFVCDLAKNTREAGKPHFRVIGLTDSTSLLLALANDEGYENIFVQQLENLLDRGDIVIAISASGNSPNVVKAVDYANRAGALTIGFTGYDGGIMGQMVDINVHIKSSCIEQVEDIHLVLEHMIIKSLKAIQEPALADYNSDLVLVSGEDVAH